MYQTLSTWLRAYPRVTSITLALLSLLSLAAGCYAYVLFQWQAAKTAVSEKRLDEARACLKICLFVWPRSAAVHLLAARTDRMQGDFEAAEGHLNYCLSRESNSKEDAELEY